jgi:hypothetical protein
VKKWILYVLCIAGLVAVNQAMADVVASKVIAHCQDQGNDFANDPKWLFGEKVMGQTFIPSKDKISLLRATVYRRTDGGAYTGNANLEIRLWKCKDGYDATKNSQPVLFVTDEKKPAFANRFYFPMSANLEPGKPYYLEFSVPMAPENCYYYAYQYQGNFYPAGEYSVNGTIWAGSDLNFTTYYPVELAKGQMQTISGQPEVLEVQFSGKVDPATTKAFLSGPSGIVKTSASYGENTAYLGPLTLPAYAAEKTAYKLTVQSKGDNGTWQTAEYPFTCERTGIDPVTDIKATADDNGVTLTWKASPAAAEYRIYRFTESGKTPGRGEKFIGRIKADQTTYQDPAKDKNGKDLLSKGTTYYYEVLALDKTLSKTGLSTEKEIAIP